MSGKLAPCEAFDTILVLDFGSQYSHLITRRLRDIKVYSELQPCTFRLADLTWKPKGIIFSGGPYSVYDQDAPHVDENIFSAGIPILGICYGLQEIAWHHGRNVVAGQKREYGRARLEIHQASEGSPHAHRLLAGLGQSMDVFMSHGDKLAHLPPGYNVLAVTENAPYAAIAHETMSIYGVQFHPEVTHTPRGCRIIENFAVGVCGARQLWTMDEFVSGEISRIREMVGPRSRVIGAVSGGVDSTVAAKLMDKAIGSRFHAVLIDNGLLRKDEAATVRESLSLDLGINLTVVDAASRFLHDLQGVSDPEKKRRIIGSRFIKEFQDMAQNLEDEGGSSQGRIEWLLQGTLYPDVIESISFKGPSQTIKTHHNVGGLPDFLHLRLIEPLRLLFKDEVRVLGTHAKTRTKLGISHNLVWRHPFPGPGLAIRILGEINEAQLQIARQADAIFMSELLLHGLYEHVSQAFAALIPSRAVGVMGDKRAYGQMIALRAVTTTDFMTARRVPFDITHRDFLDHVSGRITNEVQGVSRVLYDVTSKPP